MIRRFDALRAAIRATIASAPSDSYRCMLDMADDDAGRCGYDELN